MARKFLNPYAKTPAQIKAALHAPAVDAYMKAHPEINKVSLSEIKLAVPAAAADLNKNVMDEITALIPLEIENGADADS